MKIFNCLFFILLLIASFAHGRAINNPIGTGKGPAVKMITINNTANKAAKIDIEPAPILNSDEIIPSDAGIHLTLQSQEKKQVSLPFSKNSHYNIRVTTTQGSAGSLANDRLINTGDTIQIASKGFGFYIAYYDKAGNLSWTTKKPYKSRN
jgi:hypothetical protein